jgi:P27 family predicted phage terminase small subunit
MNRLDFSDRLPESPGYLTDCGRAHWREIAQAAADSGIALTAADADMLALYCSAFSDWRRAEDHVRAEGEVVGEAPERKVNVWLEISARASQRLMFLSDRLGFSPRARAEISRNDTGESWKD